MSQSELYKGRTDAAGGRPSHYFIVTLASAKAAGTFEGALGPDSTPKASLVKACWNSSISAGVICLFIFVSYSTDDPCDCLLSKWCCNPCSALAADWP